MLKATRASSFIERPLMKYLFSQQNQKSKNVKLILSYIVGFSTGYSSVSEFNAPYRSLMLPLYIYNKSIVYCSKPDREQKHTHIHKILRIPYIIYTIDRQTLPCVNM